MAAKKRQIDDDARPRGQRVGLSLREAQALRGTIKDLSDRLIRVESKLSHWSDGLSDAQFIDTMIAQITALSTNKLPRKKMVTAFLQAGLETRAECRKIAAELAESVPAEV